MEDDPGQDLLQAGIGAGYWTVSPDGSSYGWDVWIYSITGSTAIQKHDLLSVSAGQRLDISIWQVQGTTWEVEIGDMTTGGQVVTAVASASSKRKAGHPPAPGPC